MRKEIIRLSTAALVAALGMAACSDVREKRNSYFVPEGYTGWICVTFGAEGPPLTKNAEGFQVIRVPSSGVVVTSTTGRPGVGFEDRFYFYSSSGAERDIPASVLGGGGTYSLPDWPEGRYTYFFWIGEDRSRFRLAIEPKAAASGPKCGPV